MKFASDEQGDNQVRGCFEVDREATAPFDIKYVACNKKKGTGGRIVHLKQCNKTGFQPNQSNQPKKESSKVAQEILATESRNPNYYEHYTRNFKVVPSGQIRMCNIWLIIEFNGKKVNIRMSIIMYKEGIFAYTFNMSKLCWIRGMKRKIKNLS